MAPPRVFTVITAFVMAVANISAAGARVPQQHHILLARPPSAHPAVRTTQPSSVRSRTATAGLHTQVQPLRSKTAPTQLDRAPKAGAQSVGLMPHPKPAVTNPPVPPAAEVTGSPPGSSPCQRRLTPDVAVVSPLPAITGPGSCGAEDLVRLESVVLENGQRIKIVPAATLRCPMAEAVVQWVRDKLAPAAATTLSSPARTIATAGSYECRKRDRVQGAQLSEHSRADALDLRSLTLANGAVVDFTDKSASKEFRELVRQSACNTFTTVLGPGSDSSHTYNIHLDLIERKRGYRICQWDVLSVPEVGTLSSKQPPSSKSTN